jgi:ribose transport system permease protein
LQSSVLLLLALPMTFVILTEGLDLSIGAVLSLCSVVLALAAVRTDSFVVALAVAVAVGLVGGALHGALVAYLRIPPFVAALGTFGIAQSLALIVSGRPERHWPAEQPSVFSTMGRYSACAPDRIHRRRLCADARLALPHALRQLRLRSGRQSGGFDTGRRAVASDLLAVYGPAGTLAGVAGLLLASRLNAGHPTAGIGMESTLSRRSRSAARRSNVATAGYSEHLWGH